VVANASSGLAEAKRLESKTDARLNELELANTLAKVMAREAQEEVSNAQKEVANFSTKRDEVENAIMDAKALLRDLEAKNRTAYDDYFLYKGAAPEAKAMLRDAAKDADEVALKLKTTKPVAQQAHVEARVRHDELQAAIAELNKRNEKLKRVEAQLPKVVIKD